MALILKCISLKENIVLLWKVSVKSVPNTCSTIDGKQALISFLIQIMACHQTLDKPLLKPMMIHLTDVIWLQWVTYYFHLENLLLMILCDKFYLASCILPSLFKYFNKTSGKWENTSVSQHCPRKEDDPVLITARLKRLCINPLHPGKGQSIWESILPMSLTKE